MKCIVIILDICCPILCRQNHLQLPEILSSLFSFSCRLASMMACFNYVKLTMIKKTGKREVNPEIFIVNSSWIPKQSKILQINVEGEFFIVRSKIFLFLMFHLLVLKYNTYNIIVVNMIFKHKKKDIFQYCFETDFLSGRFESILSHTEKKIMYSIELLTIIYE